MVILGFINHKFSSQKIDQRSVTKFIEHFQKINLAMTLFRGFETIFIKQKKLGKENF